MTFIKAEASEDWSVTSQPMRIVIVSNDDPPKAVVTVHADGNVELGDDVTLNEASRAFWDAIQVHRIDEVPRPTRASQENAG